MCLIAQVCRHLTDLDTLTAKASLTDRGSHGSMVYYLTDFTTFSGVVCTYSLLAVVVLMTMLEYSTLQYCSYSNHVLWKVTSCVCALITTELLGNSVWSH